MQKENQNEANGIKQAFHHKDFAFRKKRKRTPCHTQKKKVQYRGRTHNVAVETSWNSTILNDQQQEKENAP